jgi:hypothetical protein
MSHRNENRITLPAVMAHFRYCARSHPDGRFLPGSLGFTSSLKANHRSQSLRDGCCRQATVRSIWMKRRRE